MTARRWGIGAAVAALGAVILIGAASQRGAGRKAGVKRRVAAGRRFAGREQAPVADRVGLSDACFAIVLGQRDTEPTLWSGTVSVARGTIASIEPLVRRPGVVAARDGRFRFRTRPVPVRRRARAKKAAKRRRMAAEALLVAVRAPASAEVTVATEQGTFSFLVSEPAPGRVLRFLQGRAQVTRVPAYFRLAGTDAEEDFPAAAAAGDAVWVAYLAHDPVGPRTLPRLDEIAKDFSSYRPKGGGDRLWAARLTADGGSLSVAERVPLTDGGLDLYRPAVAVGRDGRAWVVWSQNDGGNWDLHARAVGEAKRIRLTTDPGADVFPAAATDAAGRVWVAWQGFRDGKADIWLAEVGGERAGPVRVSTSAANDWNPAIACDAKGSIWVAWDTYDRGNYDILLRRYDPAAGKLADAVPIACSPRLEFHPSIACDKAGRVWVAYEVGPENWGKDFGALVRDQGQPLYRARGIEVRCRTGAGLERPAALGEGWPQPLRGFNSHPRIAVDRSGRVWVAFRHRGRSLPVGGRARSPVGTVWTEYVTALGGTGWSAPIPVPRTDNLLDNRPSVLALGSGGILIVGSTDGREARPQSIGNDLYAAVLSMPAAGMPRLAGADAGASAKPSKVVHAREPRDLERIRAYRAAIGAATYRLARGEFHRHTEISGDGGGDGALEDMWRYALDVASMDWIGNGDHDNGGGREYSWWITQKTTDIFHHPPRFVPMFSYERSVRFPDGHRNPVFAERGIRTLPRLAGTQPNGVAREDASMLYAYLRFFGGVCASHTSGTNMGTDWRDNDPAVEPIVEIYQGCRQSYEALGAPKTATGEGDSLGGWRPSGMVWNALQKGYRLGFQSSSDHVSTHISYAILYVKEPLSRAGILDALKRRHCYGATDNIILDVRCAAGDAEHMMGDIFTVRTPPTIRIKAIGTRAIRRIDIVQDNRYVHSVQPGEAEAELSWTPELPAGKTSYVYVRVGQEDDQIAWGSPMWITYRP